MICYSEEAEERLLSHWWKRSSDGTGRFPPPDEGEKLSRSRRFLLPRE